MDQATERRTPTWCSRGAERELPKYKCHKLVRALKIGEIRFNEDEQTCVLTPSDPDYGPLSVGLAYFNKHCPKTGGYYVVYDDRYESFSPADAFEAGYTLLEN